MKKLIVFLVCGFSVAQVKISLQDAIQLLKERNHELEIMKDRVKVQETLQKDFMQMDPLEVGGEFGNLNGPLFDNRVLVRQRFEFPTVYGKRKKVLELETQKSAVEKDIFEKELLKELHIQFYNYRWVEERLTLLKKSDSVWNILEKKVTAEVKTGESSKIFLENVKIRKAKIENERKNLEREKNQILWEVNHLLHTEKYDHIPDISSLEEFPEPQIKGNGILTPWYETQAEIAKKNANLVGNKRLPNIVISVQNSSFAGFAPDNLFYTTADRFYSYFIGLEIPLFSGKRIKEEAFKLEQEIQEKNLEHYQIKNRRDIQKKWNDYTMYSKQLVEMQKNILPATENLLKMVLKNYQVGEVHYWEFSQTFDSYVETFSAYSDIKKNKNILAVEIFYQQQNTNP